MGVTEAVYTRDHVGVVVEGVHEVVGLRVVEDVFHVCGLHCEMRVRGRLVRRAGGANITDNASWEVE